MDKLKALRKASLGGGLLAGITASLCCLGPLIALGLGAGGFAASALFAKWRPLFLGATFALLALAWYLTYRKPKTACEAGSTCAAKPVSRWSKAGLALATAFALVAAAFPNLLAAMVRPSAGSVRCFPVATDGRRGSVLKMSIPGMDCAACAAGIEAMLRKESGVLTAEVNFAAKRAVVRYDPTKSSPEKIIAAIDRTGFKAKPE